MFKRFLAVFALAGVSVSLCAAVPDFSTLIAHRGESVDAPENTLPAYRMAVDRGFGFECDLYLSTDGRVFSFHDTNLKRTTGVDLPCGKASWADTLSRIDAGAWKGPQWKGTRPALLEEILQLARDGRFIYIEIKAGPEIVPYVKDVFAKQKQATPKNALFICFNKKVCRELRHQMPTYTVYWLTGARTGRKKPAAVKTADQVLAGLRESEAQGLDIQYDPKLVTKEFVARIEKEGYSVHVWTVDHLTETLKAFAAGARTVTTNCAKRQLDAYRASLK